MASGEPIYLTETAERLLQKLARLDAVGYFDRGFAEGLGNGPPRGPLPTLLAKPNTAISKGSSGTFTIWSSETNVKGAETSTGAEIEDVYCRVSAVTTTQFCYIQPIDCGWEAVPAPPECE